MIVIGSKAMTYHMEQTTELEERYMRSDYDVMMTQTEFSKWMKEHKPYIQKMYPTKSSKYKVIVEKDGRRKQYEIELGFAGTSAAFVIENQEEICEGTMEGFFGESMQVMKLPYLMLTKRSHLIYPVHFEKNMNDYQTMKQMIGTIKKDKTMNTYYTLRYEEAEKRYNQKTPNLNVTTEDFFSSKLAVKHYFVHDDIHEMVKHQDTPIFRKMQKDDSKAWCDKNMFFELPFLYQVQAVQEEAYVIALERYIVPKRGEDWEDFFGCYKKALARICTTLCSGFFRDFAIENYDEAIKQYNPNFVENFKEFVRLGKITPIEGRKVEEVPLMVG